MNKENAALVVSHHPVFKKSVRYASLARQIRCEIGESYRSELHWRRPFMTSLLLDHAATRKRHAIARRILEDPAGESGGFIITFNSRRCYVPVEKQICGVFRVLQTIPHERNAYRATTIFGANDIVGLSIVAGPILIIEDGEVSHSTQSSGESFASAKRHKTMDKDELVLVHERGHRHLYEAGLRGWVDGQERVMEILNLNQDNTDQFIHFAATLHETYAFALEIRASPGDFAIDARQTVKNFRKWPHHAGAVRKLFRYLGEPQDWITDQISVDAVWHQARGEMFAWLDRQQEDTAEFTRRLAGTFEEAVARPDSQRRLDRLLNSFGLAAFVDEVEQMELFSRLEQALETLDRFRPQQVMRLDHLQSIWRPWTLPVLDRAKESLTQELCDLQDFLSQYLPSAD